MVEREENNIFKKHHAFLILHDNGEEFLNLSLKENFGLENFNDPDFWRKDVETFGIEDSRELKSAHLKKTFKKNGNKIFVVKTKYITGEAQNALLKILEDPKPKTYFLFLLPSKESLIPTLLSRFFVMEGLALGEAQSKASNKLDFEISVFLSLSPAARIKTLSKIISGKDKDSAILFLNELEKFLHQKINLNKTNGESIEIFESIIESRDYLKLPSSSIKMILENICLSLPRL